MQSGDLATVKSHGMGTPATEELQMRIMRVFMCALARVARLPGSVLGASAPVIFYLFLALFTACLPARAEEDPTADHYYRGNALYNRNMHALAIEEYRLFLSKHPSHAKAENARHGMALSYYAMGKYAEAEPLLKSLVEKGRAGKKEQLVLLRGQCLLNLDKAADAEAAFASAIRSKSREIVSNALAGVLEAQHRQGEWAECMATADKLLQADITPDYRKRALYQAAYACHQLAKFAQALPYLEKLVPLVKEDPMAPQVAFFLAESYRETGKLDEAAEHYAAAVGGFEGDVAADVYYRLGSVHFTQSKYDDAIAAFGKSLQLRKEGGSAAEAQLYLGRSWLEKEDFKRAAKYLQPLSERAGSRQARPRHGKDDVASDAETSARAALWLGRVYSRQNKYDQAATVLAGAISRFKRSSLLPNLYFDHANALMAGEKFAEAAASFAKIQSFKEWPQISDAMRLRAVCLHQAGDYQNSLKAADEFIAKFKSDPLASEVFFVKAEDLYLLDRLDEAATGYSHFASTYPTNASAGAAAFRLGQVHHKKGRWAEAIKTILPLVARQPEGKVFSQLNFIAGDCHFRLEQWRQAASNLTAFVKAQKLPSRRDPRKPPTAEPNIDSALIELSLAHVKLADPNAAMTYLKLLVGLFDKSVHRPLATSELGRLQYEAGDMNGALKTLSSFVSQYEKHPQRPKVEYYLGWIALKQDQLEKAEQHFAVVANSYARDSLGPDASLQLGLVQMSREKFDEARRTLSRLIKTYPQHPRMDLALFSFGVANARLERWQEASTYFQRVVKDFPKSDHADDSVYEWAWSEKGLKRNGEAVERYRYLIETYPESELVAKATTEMAELTYGAGKYDEAISQLTRTLAEISDPGVKEQTLYRLGTAYFNKGDFEKSAETFEGFVKQYPESTLRASALFQAGESRMKVKETIAALGHFEAANRIKNLSPALKESVLLRLGEALGLTKEWQRSRDSYRQLLAQFPESKWKRHAFYGQAWAEENLSQHSKARELYQKATDPHNRDLLSARAQFQMGECLFAQKRYDEAIRELVPLQVAYKYKDWAAKALLETGRIMEAKGDKAGAMAQFKEVMSKFPDDNAAVVAKERLDVLRREQ